MKVPLHEQFKMVQEYQHDSDNDDSLKPASSGSLEILHGEDKKSSHRRVHTMISHSNVGSNATPRSIKDHHRKMTVTDPNQNAKLKDISSASVDRGGVMRSIMSTPRKISRLLSTKDDIEKQ